MKDKIRSPRREAAIMGEVKITTWPLLSSGGGVFIITRGFVIENLS